MGASADSRARAVEIDARLHRAALFDQMSRTGGGRGATADDVIKTGGAAICRPQRRPRAEGSRYEAV